MIGLGTIVNVAAILFGGSLGLLFKKLLTERLTNTIMQGLGLAVIIIGLSGTLGAMFKVDGTSLSAEYTLIMIISLVIGAFIGELIGIEARLDALVAKCGKKFSPTSEASTFSQGLITATLVFCVGAMSIVGAIEDGINKNYDVLFAKAALDAVTGMIFASTLGVGVLFSIIPLSIYQGLITLLAVFISPYLSAEIISQMSVIGSVLILAIGLNLLGVAKIKVGNLLPSIFVPVVYSCLPKNMF